MEIVKISAKISVPPLDASSAILLNHGISMEKFSKLTFYPNN